VPSHAERRHSRLIEALHSEYGHLRITAIRHIGQGMDAMVYHAYSQELGQLAIKLPYSRWVSSGNESHLDTRMLLRQEAELSKHLRVSGLPTPEVFVLHTDDDGVDFLIEEFITSDDSTLSEPDFGRLILSIHRIPVPAIDLVASKSARSIDEVLADRIEDRLGKLAEIVGLPDGIPDIGSALAADRRDDQLRSLLHMDLRAENILVRSSLAVAILDWSNALIGDPGLDLARAAEYGSLTEVALAAYGGEPGFRMIPETPREIVYRLDTAVMLSHVFLNGAPDEAKARFYIDRTTNYCRALLLP
jgi:aminoglycoside phosphotransferase (APT) family kinase protein